MTNAVMFLFGLAPQFLVAARQAGCQHERDNRGQGRRLKVPAGIDLVRLQLVLRGGRAVYTTYRATLRTGDGREVWSQDAPPSGQTVVLDLSPKVLLPNEYDLTLQGIPATGAPEDAGRYHFAVFD